MARNYEAFMRWRKMFFCLPIDTQIEIVNKFIKDRYDEEICVFDEEEVNKHYNSPYHAACSLKVNDVMDNYFIVDSEGEGHTFELGKLEDEIWQHLEYIFNNKKYWENYIDF